MLNTMRIAALAAVAGGVVACGGAGPQGGPESRPSSPEEVSNIILLIADGGGAGLWSVAAYGGVDLAVKTMPVMGFVDTRSSSHRVTDSAAGASVYATGERVSNRTISVGPECPVPRSNDTTVVAWAPGCERLESWFRVAGEKGKAMGVVTTSSVVDATPAAFVANSPSRYWSDMIAEQMVGADLAVLLGGGRRSFVSETRNDHQDLLGPLCARSDCVADGSELAAYRPTDRPLVGLFAPGDMDSGEGRTIGLPDMVSAALARLEQSPTGFVALFESESTDNATHSNRPLEELAKAILEFDRAVGVALEFARSHPGTLVVVTADHETGGVSLVESGTEYELKYTTGGHSAEPVPLFAEGPMADRFGGFQENYEIGRTLMEIARGW